MIDLIDWHQTHDNHNDKDGHDDDCLLTQVAQRTAAKLAPRFESPDEMSDEEEILFDDIYEVVTATIVVIIIPNIITTIIIIITIIILLDNKYEVSIGQWPYCH